MLYTLKQKQEALIQTLRQEGIHDELVLAAIRKIPCELFVLTELQNEAYSNVALPIACQQTISQPYIVARMTEALNLSGPMDKVLEVGTGSGYQAAILAEIAKEVHSIERIKILYEQAKIRLQKLHIDNIKLHHGDGYLGWPEFAPYDAIMVTAATPYIPKTLLEQLRIGGRMVLPIGDLNQRLILIYKTSTDIQEQLLDMVKFVPLLPGI